jgi:hypothetical protein
VLAQQTRPRQVTVPETVILELEKAAAERDHLRGVVTLKDQQIAAQGEQIAALNGLVSIERMRAESWSKAALERKDALASDDKVFQLQGAEITRLRTERDDARKANKFWGFGGLVLGVALGYYGTRRN